MSQSKQTADFLERLKARHNSGPAPPPPAGASPRSRYASPYSQPSGTRGEGVKTGEGRSLPPPPNGGFLSTSLSNRNVVAGGPPLPPVSGGAGRSRRHVGPLGGKRPPKRVYPVAARGLVGSGQSGSSGTVGGFAGGGQGCRPSAGALLCFLVGFVVIIVSVVITAYAVLSNEKNSFGMAIALNDTLFFGHIAQTQPSSKESQARVGIHNADPQATLEVTTHGGIQDADTTLRLSRSITQEAVEDDVTRQMKSSLEFGFYAADLKDSNTKRGIWVQGAQVSSDLHTGSLHLSSGVGSASNRTRRERALLDNTAESGETLGHQDEEGDVPSRNRAETANVWNLVDSGNVQKAASALRRVVSKGETRKKSRSRKSHIDENFQNDMLQMRQGHEERRQLNGQKCHEGSLYLNAEEGACGDVSIAAGGGNVGIGVEAPRSKLDIDGNVLTSGTIKLGGSIQLGKMTITNGTTAAGLQACKVPGEVRYTTDEFYGCTKDRGWVPLTATFHSQYNGTLGQMAYFVGPTGQTGSTGIHWKDKYQEFRLQSQHESEPTTKVSTR